MSYKQFNDSKHHDVIPRLIDIPAPNISNDIEFNLIIQSNSIPSVLWFEYIIDIILPSDIIMIYDYHRLEPKNKTFYISLAGIIYAYLE